MNQQLSLNPYTNYIPNIVDKNIGSERIWDLWSRLNNDRIVFLGDKVDSRSANVIIAQLLFLEADDPVTPIQMYINSPGGNITDGLAIYDTMNYIAPEVHTVCIGQAASMAATLLAAGTKGRRYCLPNVSIMIHQPIGGTSGQASDIEIQAKRILFLKDKLTQILADRTGNDYEKVVQDGERDYWMTAQEAFDYGIVDHILKNRSDI